MELISFNTWGGRLGDRPIREFCEKYRDTDIFCFQEIWETENLTLIDDSEVHTQLLSKISTYLPDHQSFFRPQYRGVYGLATFVHNQHFIEDEGELFVFKEQGYENPTAMGNHARNIQYLHLKIDGKPLSIINFHGLWNGQGKTDTPDRISQSKKIVAFMEQLTHPFLIAEISIWSLGQRASKSSKRPALKT